MFIRNGRCRRALDRRRARAPGTGELGAGGSRVALRRGLSECLRAGAPRAAEIGTALIAQSAVDFTLPARVGNYSDFYTSIHHATAVGRLFRPDQPLLPNYKWVPIAYHGRASSVVISGQEVRRPSGQIMPRAADLPRLAPSARLDYEL